MPEEDKTNFKETIAAFGTGTSKKLNISIVKADITKLQVDVIVNAANTSLLGGGGVDGAIHRAAGPELLAECRTLNGAQTGEAKMTKGYMLPAKYVIHTPGPIWRGGGHQEPEQLKSCWRQSLMLAAESQLHSIAFPSISTGIYSYPLRDAAQVAMRTVVEFLCDNLDADLAVTVAAFDQGTMDAYKDALDQAMREKSAVLDL